MIHEISNFIEYLEKNGPEVFSENLKLREGMYVFLEKEGDELVVQNDNVLIIKKDTNEYALTETEKKLYNQFCLRYYNSLMLSGNKSFLGKPGTFSEIGSPFGISFKKEKLLKDNKEIKKANTKLIDNLNLYFKNAEKYLEENNKNQFLIFEEFKNFCKTKLLIIVEEVQILKDYPEDKNIYIFHKSATDEDFIKVYNNYLKNKVFLKADSKEFGVCSDLNFGNEQNKPFVQHLTAPFFLNYQVHNNVALNVHMFFRLQQKNKIIPNPMPIFIYENELTEKVIKFYKNDSRISHKEITEELLKTKENLQNYYLIYFDTKLNGSCIIDLDFVPVFKYKTDDMPEIKAIFNIESKENGPLFYDYKIKNVFEFQEKVVNKIFNKQLIIENKNGQSLRYFGDIEVKPEFGATETIVNLLYKYRKSFYDYIYKSREEAITDVIFDDIMYNSILDDVRHDEKYNKTYAIKEKLNIWFSLYNYFKKDKNSKSMASKIIELIERCRKIANNDDEHLSDDKEFAFAAGQIIYFLLNQSAASNKTHALLEPFLQKTTAEQLQNAICQLIGVYKHALEFGHGRFERLSKEVLAYETNTDMKKLQRFILAGYFAEPVIYEKTKI